MARKSLPCFQSSDIYPFYWIKRLYRSEHFRQFLVICMACALVISVFLTIFLAYDNAQLSSCLSHICVKR